MSAKKSIILLGMVLASGIASADITTGLMSRWSFDNCKATDNSGNGNNGTIVGGLKCVAGISGKAMQFNGATSYIKVPSSASLNPANQLTMSFWVKVQGVTNMWSPLLHKGGVDTVDLSNREYSVWLNEELFLHQSSAGDGDGQNIVVNSSKISKLRWIHYVGIIDRINHVMSIFLNGKKVAQVADSSNSFNNNNHDLRIGSTEEADSSYSPFKGILDDIRLYNRALTSKDIAELYNIGQPIAGVTTGMQQFAVTCTNTTTGQTVTIPSQSITAWDCKKAGLITNPNQQIHIGIDGNTFP